MPSCSRIKTFATTSSGRFSNDERENMGQVMAAQHIVHLIGGILPHFSFFYAQAEFCSQAESTPTRQHLTQAVGWQTLPENISG